MRHVLGDMSHPLARRIHLAALTRSAASTGTLSRPLDPAIRRVAPRGPRRQA